MLIQLTAIILLAAIAIGSFFIYNKMNRTYYVEYTEKGSIEYMVKYGENEFFDTDWIGMNQTYISSLIEGVSADFTYRLNTDSKELGFNYQYRIDAKVLIASKDSGAPYYTYEETIFPPKESPAKSDSAVQIKEIAWIDYVKYNQMAKSFIQTYDLKNVSSCTLIVTLSVDLLSSGEKLATGQNHYTTSLNIPLAVDSLNVYATSSSPDNEVRVLEYKNNANRAIFFNTAISAAALDALLILLLIVFLHLTKNEDVTYAAKIRRILRSYGSFIQRMEGEFDYEGYQSVMIKSFSELLGIRDTIQSPVLMSENHDETMTRFLIPTSNARILYVFEIKVDNYDEIYSRIEQAAEETELEAEQEAVAVIEEIAVEETKVEDEIQEPVIEEIPAVIAPVVAEKKPVAPTVKKTTRTVTKERRVIKKVAPATEVKKEDSKKIKHPWVKILIAIVAVRVIRKITKK